MVVLAAIIVIMFLTSASTDRTTSTSFNYRYQAELAVQNGLEAAKRALTTDGVGNLTTQTDTFVVTRVASPPIPTAINEDITAHYYYIGRVTTGSTNITYYPLFSGGGAPQSIAVTGATTQPIYTAPTSNIATDVSGTNLPTLLPDPSPSPTASPASLLPRVTTQWVDVVDPQASPSPAPWIRYSFWTEDLGGYIDAAVAGNTDGASSSHSRDLTVMQPLLDSGSRTPAALLAMWTLFGPTSTDASASPQQGYNQNLVNQRSLLFTSETVRQALATPTPSSTELSKTARHVVAGTKSDLEQQVIPYGVNARAAPIPAASYPNAGQAKIDINAKISAKDVTAIADAIKANLPDWAAARRGGLASDDTYRHTIAANVITYAQPAADAPIVGADYRGVGAYPLVNEFYDYINWTSSSPNSVTFEITTWVELWNMTNKTISGDVRFSDYYRHRLDLGVNQYFDDTHDPERPPAGETVSGIPFPTQTITMGPNEFKVLSFGPATYTLSTGGTIPPSPLTLNFTTSGRYKLEWKSSSGGFVTVDQASGGIQMATDSIYNPQESSTHVPYKWNGSLPGFSYYGGVASFYYNPGDPRSAFYNTAPQAANDYSSNVTMWSRNAKPSSSKIIGQEVKPSRWADGGHDTSMISKIGSKDTVPPSTIAPAAPTPEPSKAAMAISNAGKLKSITELGNVYDPAQWNMSTTGDKWSDIDSTATADSHYGGGITLRIGRPEFSRFDKDGVRASQLLDIFSAGARRETQGLVNLNTATRETLRALGAGLMLNRDSAMKDSGGNAIATLYPPYTTNQADKFADAVINSRNSKTFLSTSQLVQLKDSSNAAFFGNTAQWTNTPIPSEWNDAGAEEYLARIFDLASVRSRNFRVFVTGQYVDPRPPYSASNPHVLSTVRKVYQVFLHPTRAPNGSIQSQTIDLTYEREL